MSCRNSLAFWNISAMVVSFSTMLGTRPGLQTTRLALPQNGALLCTDVHDCSSPVCWSQISGQRPKLCELLHITAILFPGGARVQATTANLVKSTTKKPLDGLTRLVDLPRSQKEEPNR